MFSSQAQQTHTHNSPSNFQVTLTTRWLWRVRTGKRFCAARLPCCCCWPALRWCESASALLVSLTLATQTRVQTEARTRRHRLTLTLALALALTLAPPPHQAAGFVRGSAHWICQLWARVQEQHERLSAARAYARVRLLLGRPSLAPGQTTPLGRGHGRGLCEPGSRSNQSCLSRPRASSARLPTSVSPQHRMWPLSLSLSALIQVDGRVKARGQAKPTASLLASERGAHAQWSLSAGSARARSSEAKQIGYTRNRAGSVCVALVGRAGGLLCALEWAAGIRPKWRRLARDGSKTLAWLIVRPCKQTSGRTRPSGHCITRRQVGSRAAASRGGFGPMVVGWLRACRWSVCCSGERASH